MAPKKPAIKIPKPPKGLVDLIAKIVKNDASKTTRAGRDLTRITSRSIGMGKSAFPKVAPKPIPKPTRPLVKPSARPKGVGKVAAVAPERPPRAPSLKGKTLPKTAAEIREAERQGRRSIKIASGTDPKPSKSLSKPKSDAKPVDVKGSIVAVPPKASIRPPKPSKGSYEADKTKGVIKSDRELMGRGQKVPKSALSYAERESARKAKDAERLAALKKGPSVQAGELRKAIDAAKSPKQKKVAQQNLIDFLLKKK
jgi:hypothetical protein